MLTEFPCFFATRRPNLDLCTTWASAQSVIPCHSYVSSGDLKPKTSKKQDTSIVANEKKSSSLDLFILFCIFFGVCASLHLDAVLVQPSHPSQPISSWVCFQLVDRQRGGLFLVSQIHRRTAKSKHITAIWYDMIWCCSEYSSLYRIACKLVESTFIV